MLKYSRSQLERERSAIDGLALNTLENLRFKEHPYLGLSVTIPFRFGAAPIQLECCIVSSYGQ